MRSLGFALLACASAAAPARRSPGSAPARRPLAGTGETQGKRAATGRWAHAPVTEWTEKSVRDPAIAASEREAAAARRPASGRGRSAKREVKYEALKLYAESHLRLLQAELEEERAQARQRLQEWGRERLAREGAALFELSAMAKEKLYSDNVVRLDLRGVLLPFHRFAAGDLVTISPTESNGPLPPPPEAGFSLLRPDARSGARAARGAEEDGEYPDLAAPSLGSIDGAVLSRSQRFIDVCVRPRSTEEAATVARLGGGAGRWRLDAAISAVPYDRMALALAEFTETTSATPAEDALQNYVVRSFCAPDAAAAAGDTPPPLGAALKPPKAALADAAERAKLDDAQRRALAASFARALSLVQGPPGTGKTRTACAIALATSLTAAPAAAGRAARTGRSLLVAPSNVAADNLLAGCLALGLRCVRLGRPAFARVELRHLTLDALVSPPVGATDERAHSEHMQRRWNALAEAEVVVATATGSGELLLGPMATAQLLNGAPPRARFDLCLVDESSQCVEPAVLLALLAAARAPRLVLVGDQCQLGPVLLSRPSLDVPLAGTRGAGGARGAARGGAADASESLFARLVGCGLSPELLAVQYRMPEALIEFSAKRFYQGRLRTACAHAGASRPALVGAPFDWAPGSLPLLFVDTADAEPSGSFHEQRRSADTRGTAEAAAVVGEARPGGQPVYGATSYRNPCEARLAAAAVRALVAGGLKAADIGVITPYAAQVRAIGDELGGGGGWGGDVEVSSVDGFQGREKEAIVLSAVRSNANRATGFLKDWRRLNVSITRARRCIIVIGDSRTLSADPSWGAFINHARKRGGYVKIGAAPGAAERGPARATPEPDAGSGSAAAASAAAA